MYSKESNKERIENDYTYHAPKEGQEGKYQAIREKTKELAFLINDVVPVGREQSTAFTLLEQACMMANAGIARSK